MSTGLPRLPLGPPPRLTLGPAASFTTRPAEEQFLALSPADRQRTRRALQRPVNWQCGKVPGSNDTPLYRLKLSHGMRASIAPVADGRCVVHIGSCEEALLFADRYAGPPAAFIPLTESAIMKSHDPPPVAPTTTNWSPEPSILRLLQALLESVFAFEVARMEDEILKLLMEVSGVRDELRDLAAGVELQAELSERDRAALAAVEERVGRMEDKHRELTATLSAAARQFLPSENGPQS